MPTPLILVCCHKESFIYQNNIINGIMLGASQKEDLLNKIYPLQDNTGEDISSKNPEYCELTSIYWAFKNLSPLNYSHIGIFHYRRYLSFSNHNFLNKLTPFNFLNQLLFSFKEKNIINILKNYDIILPKKTNLTFLHKSSKKTITMQDNLYLTYNKELIDLSLKVLLKEFPHYSKAVNNSMKFSEIYFKNIFIMKTELFQEYANFLFTLFFSLEKELNSPKNMHLQIPRIYGFLAERYLNIFLEYKNLQLKSQNITLNILERELIIKRELQLSKKFINEQILKLRSRLSIFYIKKIFKKFFS